MQNLLLVLFYVVSILNPEIADLATVLLLLLLLQSLPLKLDHSSFLLLSLHGLNEILLSE